MVNDFFMGILEKEGEVKLVGPMVMRRGTEFVGEGLDGGEGKAAFSLHLKVNNYWQYFKLNLLTVKKEWL